MHIIPLHVSNCYGAQPNGITISFVKSMKLYLSFVYGARTTFPQIDLTISHKISGAYRFLFLLRPCPSASVFARYRAFSGRGLLCSSGPRRLFGSLSGGIGQMRLVSKLQLLSILELRCKLGHRA